MRATKIQPDFSFEGDPEFVLWAGRYAAVAQINRSLCILAPASHLTH